MNEYLQIPLAPLPVDVRPRLGETTVSYIQRLARANHLKASELVRHLAPPPHKTGHRPALVRLAKVCGRSTDVLANTLADATPAHLPVWTKDDLRLRRRVALRSDGFDMTGLIKQDARWNKASLRQIANGRQIPLWGLKRILSPRFPDPNPAARAFMTEDNYRRIKAHYSQGLTATETWRCFLDNHDSWIPLTTITALYITLAREPQPAESSETQ
ncbi:TniQ family protein [Streptomyces sp. NPDC020766]|uniref:TniQ family protein n=1 Tax=Streptomyces sp. NPDC020766 TaxID=3155011 RepID=UPI0033F293DF